MTALVIASDIPSAINTVEKLNAWTSLVLANINPQLSAVEGVGYTERCAQSGVFYVAADNKYRLLSRTSLQMGSDYLAGGSKMWTFTQELSTTAIPAIFKAN